MKKICALFLCAGMLFTMGACKSSSVSDKAIDKLETAIKETAKVESAEYTGKLDMIVEEVSTSLSLHGQFTNKEKDQTKMSFYLDVNNGEETISNYLSFFIDGGNYYINMMDVMKQKTSFESFKNSLGVATPTEEENLKASDLSKDDLKELFTKASYSADELALTFDTSSINSGIASALMELTADTTDLKLKDMNMNIRLENDIIKKATLTLRVQTNDEGTSSTSDITFEFALDNINKTDTVTMPDFSSYVESDLNSLLS